MNGGLDHRCHGNYVAGEWRPAAATGRADVNPADVSDRIGTFPDSCGADVDEAVAAAAGAQAGWASLGPIRRAEYLRRVANLLADRAQEFAVTITREHGKLLAEAGDEVRRTLAVLDFIAGEGRRLNGEVTPADEPRTLSFTFRAPIGVVGLITPWNFPLAIPAWKIAPALLSGCTAVVKPSPLTPLTAALLVDLFAEAGVPPGVLNLVQGDRTAGASLVADPRVAGISFTGSLAVGRAIHAAGAGRLLKSQLELGGKNAVVVLRDADLGKATDAVVAGAFGQAGQRCSATSRLVVESAVKDHLLERLLTAVTRLRVGPGTDPRADVCPVISEERLLACLRMVETARRTGATVRCGGRRLTDGLPDGFYLEPTVLSDVAPDSEIAQEEVFGPVLSVIECEDLDHAVTIVNGVRYGMSASIFTTSQSSAFEALDRLEAGMLHVNRPGVGAFPHLPHVGTKASQYGPPECSPAVWDFYCQWRSACVAY